MPECLGIDLGREAVSLAVVSRGREGLTLKSFERRAYGPAVETAPARARFAASLVSQLGLARLPLALSLPASEIFLRPVTVPFTRKSQIAKTLEFEVEGMLLFEVEHAVMDFAVLGEAQGSTRLLVAAASDEFLLPIVAPFEEAGLALKRVSTGALSASSLGGVLGTEDFSLLDAGPRDWRLSLCEKGRLIFARAAPAGAATEIESAVAAWYKQSVMAAPAGAHGRVLLTGAGAAGLDFGRLSGLAGTAVEPVSLPEAFTPGFGDIQRREIAQTGLSAVAAAAECCLGKGEFDFYSALRGRQSMLDAVFAPLAVGLLLCALIMSAFAWKSYVGAEDLLMQAAAVERTELELWKKLFPENEVPPAGVNLGLTAAVRELERSAPSGVAGTREAALLKALYVVSRSAPAAGGVEFTRFDAREGAVTIDATASDSSTPEKLAEAISAEGSFKAESRSVKGEGGRWTFVIRMTPTGAADVR